MRTRKSFDGAPVGVTAVTVAAKIAGQTDSFSVGISVVLEHYDVLVRDSFFQLCPAEFIASWPLALKRAGIAAQKPRAMTISRVTTNLFMKSSS
jgi:hypothetical protein